MSELLSASIRATTTVANDGAIGLYSWHLHPPLMPLPHRHSDIEINFLLAGTITYLHRDQVVTIPSGRLAIFWAAIPHQLTERPLDCDMCILTIPLALFLAWKLPGHLTQPLLMGELLVERNAALTDADRLAFPRWHQDFGLDQAFIALKEIEARLWRLLPAPVAPSSPAQRVAEERRVSQIAHYIVEHYAEPLTIPGIADAVGLHPSYLMTIFKATFGMTIGEYIQQYRVAQAQRLLATSEESVLTIALQTGFGSTSSFYATFKKIVGCAPLDYRRTVR